MEQNKYFRITAYHPQDDFSFIVDSNGKFEKLWQFSSYLIQKGIKVIEVSRLEDIIDINIEPAQEDKDHFLLRATADGKPEYVEHNINGATYKAVKVADRLYVPNKEAK